METIKVLVVDEFDGDRLLEQSLKRHGFDVATLKLEKLDLVAVVQKLLPDVVVINLYAPNQSLINMMLELDRLCPTPVVMFSEDQKTETIDQVIHAGVSAYIVDGLEPKRIKSIVNIAIARFKSQMALKEELKKTKTQLEERKLIDRAKAILIKSQGFTEDAAYHTLRKLAMDRNISLGEMAKNVISMASLFK